MPFDFACPDWIEKLQSGKTPIPELPLDDVAAERAVGVFNNLRLPDVPGNPSLGDAAGEWMREIVRAVFGSMATSADAMASRQVGEVFILVPKKNAKTTSAAAIALTFMLLNERRHADMLIIGPTQKISDVAFEQAKGMIDSDPEGYLQKRFHVQDHKKTIMCRVTKARLMIRTFGMDVLTGAKPVFCLIDEVHILGSIPHAADVIRQIRGGMLPFPEALLVMITTQSDHPPAGVFKSELQYARGVRDGSITENVRLLPVLYEFPEDIQTSEDQKWLDPKNWFMVTPNMGRSINLDRLVEGFERAKHDGPGEIAAWATQHLNVEVGLALHTDRWIGADYWQSCAEPCLTKAELLRRCDVVVAGFDGGGLDDLAGLVLIGRCRETRKWLFWAHAWAQTDVFQKRKEIAARLRDFSDDGDLTICPEGDPQRDFREVTQIISEINDMGLLPSHGAVGLDTYGVADLVDMLLEAGLTEDQLVGVPQGYKLSSAIWGMERKLKDRSLLHGGAPMMNWVLGNAKAELRGNNIYISKSAAGKAKIDPLTAGFNAFQLMARNPEPAGRGSMLLDMEEVLV
ncbi:terminase large subunit [Cognatishimia sp. MH4019]|uniref:terminase large subunit n=1 Tax=Cognatishimia sp. MH4019 TaxID=2854030 RepID=UPI001CD4358E|nr:terminase large subunit [Cognatishimia sp. MH4019]